MKSEMLQIQQYIKIHPVLKEDIRIRKRYGIVLNYLVRRHGKTDLWTKQTLKLYNEMFSNQEIEDKKSKISSQGIFKFRNILLVDCLCIKALNNKKLGKEFLDEVVTLFGKRYTTGLRNIYEEFYGEKSLEFINKYPDVKEILEIVQKNRAFLSRPLKRIMITANMSAGKSTLLNALAGKKISKTQNDTCTAKLHYLYNKAGEDGFSYELDHDLEMNATQDILMTDNDDNEGKEIFVGTRFRSLEEIDECVCFIDTPGVNSSMDKEHRMMSNEAIENIECDLLLYLFNGENIGSDDDIKHLQFVKDHYLGKIIFLVNRLDHYKKDVDSVKHTLETVKQDLVKLGYVDPIVYPLSAYAGYLGKMSLYGESLSEDEQDDIEYVMRKLKKDEFCYESYYPVRVSCSCKNEKLGELLLHSGLLSLENIIYQ